MRILLTGAFGNIGRETLEALLARGHQVRAFDLATRAARSEARRLEGRAGLEVCWGDLRSDRDVETAVRDVEAVVHLAFVIPRLSATGFGSEEAPERARQVNVDGTRRLLEALARQRPQPRLIFASSLHVYGVTADRQPPLRADDPIDPVEHYAQHKADCEAMVRASGLPWSILRLPATLPLRLILDPGMFEVPLDNRIEFGHVRDVAAALAAAVETEGALGRLLLIGGGPRCQLRYGDLVGDILDSIGVGMLPAEAFTRQPFPTDWLETSESERLLGYQRRTLDDYLSELRARLGWRRGWIRALRPVVRWWLLRASRPWSLSRSRRLEGVALVTGASAGIGAATARQLARAGMRVVLVARDRRRLMATAAGIHREGGEAAILPADLADEAERRRAHVESAGFFGPPDVVVNSAGFGWYGYGDEMPWETARDMIGINLEALADLTLRFLADMKRRRKGHILNIGSVVGSLPSQGVAVYAATKAFVDSLTSSLFRELVGTGVNISVVRPGAVRSAFFDRAAGRSAGRRIPTENWAVSPEAVARAVIRLVRRPRRVAYVPPGLGFIPWIEPAFGWLLDRIGPLALRRVRVPAGPERARRRR